MSSNTPSRPPPPAPVRRGRDREIWLGVFVVFGIVAVFAALFTLTDASTFRGRYLVKTVVPEASGLRRGDAVQLRGVNIGRVKGFHMLPSGVEIRLEIEGDYAIPRDSRVELSSGGLLGNAIVEVIPGRAPERLAPGGVIPGRTAEQLTDAASRIAHQTGQVLDRVQALLSDRTIRSVEDSTAELSGLLDEQRVALADLSRSLGRSAANVEVVTGPALQRSVTRVDAITLRIAEMTPRIDEALASLDRSSRAAESFFSRVERGEGTLGKLSKDDALYVDARRTMSNANKAIVQLGLLAEDVRRNPKRYLNLSLF